jgi:hypothetical protein
MGKVACVALDPERFLSAWNKAQELADAPNIVPLVTKQPVVFEDGMEVALKNTPMLRWLAGVRAEFPDANEAMSCSMRFFGITVLIERKVLGPFFNPKHGIWTEAVKALALAKCDTLKGYNEADVRARLAQLEPPPV